MANPNGIGEQRRDGYHGDHGNDDRSFAWEGFDLIAGRYVTMLVVIAKLEAGGAGQQAAAQDLTTHELAELWAALTDEVYPALVDSRPT